MFGQRQCHVHNNYTIMDTIELMHFDKLVFLSSIISVVQISYHLKYIEFCRTEICTYVYLLISTLCKFSSEEIQVFIWGTKILSKRTYILFRNINAYLPFTCVHTLTSNLVFLMANKTWLNKYLFFWVQIFLSCIFTHASETEYIIYTLTGWILLSNAISQEENFFLVETMMAN